MCDTVTLNPYTASGDSALLGAKVKLPVPHSAPRHTPEEKKSENKFCALNNPNPISGATTWYRVESAPQEAGPQNSPCTGFQLPPAKQHLPHQPPAPCLGPVTLCPCHRGSPRAEPRRPAGTRLAPLSLTVERPGSWASRLPSAAPGLPALAHGRPGCPPSSCTSQPHTRCACGDSRAWLRTHQALLRAHQRPVDAIHLVVEATGIAQVVAGAVATPQRCGQGPAVDALATLAGELFQEVRYCGDGQLVGRGSGRGSGLP